MDGLTHKEIEVACRNVGVDLSCDACAATFYTGSVRYEKHTCENPIQKAIALAVRYGGIDGDHHKAWVIDQMVRILAGKDYEEVIRKAKSGVDGPDTYDWNEGVAP